MNDHIELFLLLAGLVAACWNQFQRTAGWFRSWFVVTRRCDVALALPLVSYLNKIAKRSSSTEAVYRGPLIKVRDHDRPQRVVFEALGDAARTFWLPVPVWYSPGGDDRVVKKPDSSRPHDYGFSFVRGSLDWDQLLLAASDWEAQETEEVSSRYRILYHSGSAERFSSEKSSSRTEMTIGRSDLRSGLMNSTSPTRLLRFDRSDIGDWVPEASLDTLSLGPELLAIVSRFKFWLNSQSWAKARRVPWRLGAAFIGPPGTGKTSLARGIAEDLGLPIHVLDLASMTNADLRETWSFLSAPCIVLLEDIDGVFNGRENLTKTPGALTFDCLLNCWDGVERADGIAVIVTSNEVGKLDPALFANVSEANDEIPSRPGRIDVVVEFPPLDFAGRVKIGTRILDDITEAEALALRYPNDSGAQFQERCIRLALANRFG
jgi:hypothetical protein